MIVWLFLKRRILWLSLKPNSTYATKLTNSEYFGTLKGVNWFTSNKHENIRTEKSNANTNWTNEHFFFRKANTNADTNLWKSYIRSFYELKIRSTNLSVRASLYRMQNESKKMIPLNLNFARFWSNSFRSFCILYIWIKFWKCLKAILKKKFRGSRKRQAVKIAF